MRVNSAHLDVVRMKRIAGEQAMCHIVGDMNCSGADDNGRVALKPYRDRMKMERDIAPAGDVADFDNFGSGTAAPTRNLDHIVCRNATASRSAR